MSGAIPLPWRGAPGVPARASGATPADQATRAGAIRLGTELGGRAVAAATTFLIAVALGVHDFGLFIALSGIAQMAAQLGDVGLQTTVVPWLVAGDVSLHTLVRARLASTLAVAFLALPVLLVSPPLAVLSFAALGVGWVEFLGAALRARGLPGREAVLLLVLRLIALAAVALALQAGLGLTGVSAAMAVAAAPAIALAVIQLRTSVPSMPLAGIGFSSLRDVWRRSMPLAVNGLLARASLRLELFLLLILRGPVEAGLFGAALKLVEPLGAVPAAIGAGALGYLTSERVSGQADVRGRSVWLAALLGVPAAVGLALLAPDLLALLGDGYGPAALPLRVLAPAVAVMFVNAILLHALLAIGRGALLPRLTLWRLLVAGLLAAVLTPWAGATGAAIGFLAAESLLLVLASRACAAAGFPVPVARPLALALLLSLPMATAVGAVTLPVAFLALLGAFVYAVTLFFARRIRGAFAGVR